MVVLQSGKESLRDAPVVNEGCSPASATEDQAFSDPKNKRNKLSHDPNNTTWSNSTDTYGHKILSAQGWKPGDYLGAEQASHSDHYTAANASHIRVLLREDNLGLGAQVGKSNAETFGLSLFSGVLGRLNGKSDAEVERQQGALRDAELRTYQAQKFGVMGFVSGGLLVGNKIMPAMEEEEEIENPGAISFPSEDKVERKQKKRKAAQDASELDAKRSKKKSKVGTSGLDEHDADTNDVEAAKAKQKKAKRSKQTDRDAKASATTTAEDDRSRQKQEKRARKEERRKRKEEKRRLKSEKSAPESGSTSPDEQPVVVKTLAPPQDMFSGNRHAVRQRYIQQKRMASMDAQAMKEIFMLKAAA
ncbi:telomerase inhibitor [Vermiconidia calcicola]|uniref:Telomerase inhibitor n=1 Tax=Vermiconidia calcicola TaxID=1690605 RepID=A0ACC3NEN4_9PEZI|nr:telomerase inhibitor [Vermiconidia calcicola]